MVHRQCQTASGSGYGFRAPSLTLGPRNDDLHKMLEAAAYFGAAYSLVNLLRALVTVKLPSVLAEALIQ